MKDDAPKARCRPPHPREERVMSTKLIGRTTQQFIRAFQDVHRILLELSMARWDEQFPAVLKQAAKESRVVAAHASELANLHSLRKRTFNVFGTRSAIPSSAALAELERILESLRRATVGRPKSDSPRAQQTAQKEPAKKRISGTAAVVQVLMERDNKEIPVAELTAEAMHAGWSPKGKAPKQTLSSALRNEIRRRGSLARFAQGSQPGIWKLSTAGVYYANEQTCMALIDGEPDTGMRMALLMTAGDYSVTDEDDLEL